MEKLDLRLFIIHIITNEKDGEKTLASSSLQQGDSLSAFVFHPSGGLS